MNPFAPFKINRDSWLFVGHGKGASASEVIRWWEARRTSYNLIVGATGLVTCAVCLLVSIIAEVKFGEPLGLPDPPIVAVLAIIGYAIMANVCFTGGWFGELLVREIRPDHVDHFARTSLYRGLLFSVILTLLPAVLVTGTLMLRLWLR